MKMELKIGTVYQTLQNCSLYPVEIFHNPSLYSRHRLPNIILDKFNSFIVLDIKRNVVFGRNGNKYNAYLVLTNDNTFLTLLFIKKLNAVEENFQIIC